MPGWGDFKNGLGGLEGNSRAASWGGGGPVAPLREYQGRETNDPIAWGPGSGPYGAATDPNPNNYWQAGGRQGPPPTLGITMPEWMKQQNAWRQQQPSRPQWRPQPVPAQDVPPPPSGYQPPGDQYGGGGGVISPFFQYGDALGGYWQSGGIFEG